MNIRPYRQAALEALTEIKSYQDRLKLMINSGYEFLDGLTPGSIITLAGASFTGKTILMEDIKSNIMNIEYNAKADNFVWLSNSLEMTNLMTTLRELSIRLGKPKKEIMVTHFTQEERAKIVEYMKAKADERFFLNEDPMTADDFLENVEKFCKDNSGKDLIGIDFDHVALAKGQDKKKVMDGIFEHQNHLKKAYPNTLFINVSQFNRDSLSRVADKSEDMKSRRNDLYQSDALFQVSDVVACLSTPYKLGVEQYRLVSPHYYDYLSEHYGDFNKAGTKVSFNTYGRIFIEVLKNRFSDGFGTKDLFIKTIEEDSRPKEKQNNKKEKIVFDEEKITVIEFDS
jgi:replicative DNA helicase